MFDFLIQATLSNFLIALLLATTAWVVQRKIRSASLANLLWALVLIKLLTPPLFAVPIVEVPSFTVPLFTVSSVEGVETASESKPVEANDQVSSHGKIHSGKNGSFVLVEYFQPHGGSEIWRLGGFNLQYALVAILTVWALVSGFLLLFSAVRMIRFHRMLAFSCRIDSELTADIVPSVANQLNLKRRPPILTTTANVSPFVWWMNGGAVIVLSRRAVQNLSVTDLRLIVSHELAHIKRRDHWFRWLEWLAVVVYWWNPIMWWARSHLRISEEMACDQMVLETATTEVHQYASSLLNVAELLASSAIRPPVLASEINSGGHLEKRLKMMMSKKNWQAPATLRWAIVIAAICVFPWGFVQAQDLEAVERRLGGAVEAGELSLKQAVTMMEALRHSVPRDGMKATEERFEQTIRKIEQAVEQGMISEEKAHEKIAIVKRQLFERKGHQENHRRQMEEKEQHYKDVARDIKAAHEAGKISEEDVEKKLIQLKRELFEANHDDGRRRELEEKKRHYEHIARDIKAAHEAGKISEEEAEQKLMQLKRKFFEAPHEDVKPKQLEAIKQRYEQAVQAMKVAGEGSKASKERAQEKLLLLSREMAQKAREASSQQQALVAQKMHYEQIAKRIKAAEAAAEISAKEAEKKLIDLRVKMSEKMGKNGAAEKQVEEAQRQLQQASRRMQEVHEAASKSAEVKRIRLLERANDLEKAADDRKAKKKSPKRAKGKAEGDQAG
ncbi:MAG: M56 family metallopeptidase [Fuerstiella sp.]